MNVTKLDSVKVFLSDGSHYYTAIAPNRKDEELISYFVGKWFNYRIDDDVMLKCVKIEIIRESL